MSEAHTLIGLARSTNANPKFFLPPRKTSWTKDVKIDNTMINFYFTHILMQIILNLGSHKQNARFIG